jgi:hypothetical protein
MSKTGTTSKPKLGKLSKTIHSFGVTANMTPQSTAAGTTFFNNI